MRPGPRSTGRSRRGRHVSLGGWPPGTYAVEPQPVAGSWGRPAQHVVVNADTGHGRLRLRHRDPLPVAAVRWRDAPAVAVVQLDATDDVAGQHRDRGRPRRRGGRPAALDWSPSRSTSSTAAPTTAFEPRHDPSPARTRSRSPRSPAAATPGSCSAARPRRAPDPDPPVQHVGTDRAGWLDRRDLPQGPPVRRRGRRPARSTRSRHG